MSCDGLIISDRVFVLVISIIVGQLNDMSNKLDELRVESKDFHWAQLAASTPTIETEFV